MLYKLIEDWKLLVEEFVILNTTDDFINNIPLSIFLKIDKDIEDYSWLNIVKNLSITINEDDIEMFMWYPFLKRNILKTKNKFISTSDFSDIRWNLDELLSNIFSRFKNNPRYIINYKELKDIFFQKFPKKWKETRDLHSFLMVNLIDKSIYKFKDTYLDFLDTWDELLNIYPSVINSLLNQNMTTCETDSPSATFMEISVLVNLREIIGYNSCFSDITTSQNIGWCFTIWGMMGNILWILTARNNKYPWIQKLWLQSLKTKLYLIVWANYSHYSTWSWYWWLGFGEDQVIFVKNNKGMMDINDLEEKITFIRKQEGDILAIITTLWNPYSMQLDNVSEVIEVWKKHNIWVHCDAANGWILIFSEKYKKKLQGVEQADSISMDFHKALWLNYSSSVFLCKQKEKFVTNISEWNIINKAWSMDLGMTTPFVNSRWFDSFRVWYYFNYYWLEYISKKVDSKINNIRNIFNILSLSNSIHYLSSWDTFGLLFLYIPQKESFRFKEWEIDSFLLDSYQNNFKTDLYAKTWISVNLYKLNGSVLGEERLGHINVLSIHNSHEYISYKTFKNFRKFINNLT